MQIEAKPSHVRVRGGGKGGGGGAVARRGREMRALLLVVCARDSVWRGWYLILKVAQQYTRQSACCAMNGITLAGHGSRVAAVSVVPHKYMHGTAGLYTRSMP